MRPLIERETHDPRNHNTVFMVRDNAVTVNPPSRTSRTRPSREFTFDQVFNANQTQLDVFRGFAFPLVDAVIRGVPGALLAYGCTGSGKTYTMLGSPGAPGIMGHVIAALLLRMNGVSSTRSVAARHGQGDSSSFILEMTFVEVYNERVRDLLAAKGPATEDEDGRIVGPFLTLREHSSRGWHLPDALSVPITTVRDAEELLRRGSAHRTRDATEHNVASSRSHAMLTLRVSGPDTDASINLVDLAGSERAAVGRSTSRGDEKRLQEGGHINRSLLALGSCITALALGKWAPYRDSKLTLLLQKALSGQSMTGIICCLSPVAASVVDNVASIQYAARAAKVPTKAVTVQRQSTADKNTLELRATVIGLRAEVDSYKNVDRENAALKSEVAHLKEQLAAMQGGIAEMQDRIHGLERDKAAAEEVAGKVSPRRLQLGGRRPNASMVAPFVAVRMNKSQPARPAGLPTTPALVHNSTNNPVRPDTQTAANPRKSLLMHQASPTRVTKTKPKPRPRPRAEPVTPQKAKWAAPGVAILSPSTVQLQSKLDALESIYKT